MTRAPSKPVQMACLTIGFTDYLMPADKAMKVAELMQSAVNCNDEYVPGEGYVYHLQETQPDVAFKLVRPNQVRMPPGTPASPARPRLLK